MKVLLICPPDWQLQFAIGPDFMRKTDSTSRYPPLGLLYIAAYLIKNTDYEVAVIDAPLEGLSYDEIEERVRLYQPDVVGISAFTPNFLDTIEITHRVKKINPNTFVVIGGAHAHVYPAETAMLADVDAAVPGEGEKIMTELVTAIAEGRPIDQIPGLYLHGKDSQLLVTPARPPIADLDALPFPARSLLPIKAYKFVTDAKKCSTTMISSRGCEFHCAFCDIPFRKVRARSPENVVAEIENCIELGYDEINFYDDNFNFSETRVEDICKEIVKRGIHLRFSVRARVDKISATSLDWLRRAGCSRINFGIEAGDDKTLITMKKGITTSMTRRSVRMAKEAGIEVTGYFIVGIPGETEDDIRRTIDFAIELDLDYAQFMLLVLFPGTEFYNLALQKGVFDHDFYLEFARNPAPSKMIAYWEDLLPFEITHSLLKSAYRRFYMRPAYFWKQLKKLRSFNNLFQRGKLALQVMSYAVFPGKAYRPPALNQK